MRKHSSTYHPACWPVGLILGGAIGNLIDSMFYGVIYNNAPFEAPTRGCTWQVIDMIYLDLYEGFLPMSWPLIGGSRFLAVAHFQHRRFCHLHWRGPSFCSIKASSFSAR
ncbi:MAG: signal peptidase II [Hymenobacter sp.]